MDVYIYLFIYLLLILVGTIENVMPNLNLQFCSLVSAIQATMEHLKEAELRSVVLCINEYFPLKGLLTVSCSKDLFDLISDYYSYQEFEIIRLLANCYPDFLKPLARYEADLKQYEKSTNLSNFKQFSCRQMSRLTPGKVIIHNRLENKTIHSLRELLQHLTDTRFHFNKVEPTHDNNLCLFFRVRCRNEHELQLTATKKILSLHHMGVIEVMISNYTVTVKDCVNFDQSLIVAVADSEFDVPVLLDLGANPDYQDSKGQTARELAHKGEVKKLMDQVTCQRTGKCSNQ